MHRHLVISLATGLALAGWVVFDGGNTLAAEPPLRFIQSTPSVDCFDFVEVTINVMDVPKGNPFTEAEVTGKFGREGGTTLGVDGFCDSEDGSVFRIRFMPV